MIDIDYIREIRERVPAAALYEQFAEECVELAQAVLKMARHLRNENPTPITEEQIKHNLIEEASDVHLVARILDIKPDVHVVYAKLARWYDRLMDAEREAREMKESFDSSKYITRKHLEVLLHIPYTDADIALANVRYVQVTNSRWYEKTLAAEALEQLYLRRIAENHDRLVLNNCKIYHKREAIYKERLERVREFKESLEVTA